MDFTNIFNGEALTLEQFPELIGIRVGPVRRRVCR